jgi:fatty-acyl-CoA synthase
MAMLVQYLGGTCVVMRKFDPALALATIAKYRVTHSVWVPTMFVRLLKTPAEVRAAADFSSMRLALHAAAPCPIAVKEQMIDWWGPILTEFLASTEEAGYHYITTEEWLRHKGSVGRCYTATVHIVDEQGRELPAGEEGVVHYENGPSFGYGDPAKTAESYGPHGWRTVGDIGYLDADGYLYVTGRRGPVVNSGGVKIHPQEVEARLLEHPDVMDAAVIGLPDPEYGEAVTAIVQPVDAASADDRLADALRDWVREKLASVKCPKRIFFEASLPRDANGKLYRHELVARYGERKST